MQNNNYSNEYNTAGNNGVPPIQPQYQNPIPTQSEKNKNNRSKLIIFIVFIVAVAALFGLRSITGNNNAKNTSAPTESTTASTQAPVTDTTVSTTEALPVTESTTLAPIAQIENVDSSAESTSQSAPAVNATTETTVPVSTAPTDEEILKAVSDGITSLKDPSASFTGTKTQVINIKLTDCSMAVMVDPVNKVLEYFMGEENYQFDFTNGKAIDPETNEEITSSRAIPPTDKPFVLTTAGLADAKFEQVGDKKVYTIKIVPESSNLANPRPPHHNAACDTLDFSAFELPMGEVTKADFEYPGAEISVTIDSNGRIVEYHENLPMKGTGEGKLGITASGSMEGYIDEKWTIQWK